MQWNVLQAFHLNTNNGACVVLCCNLINGVRKMWVYLSVFVKSWSTYTSHALWQKQRISADILFKSQYVNESRHIKWPLSYNVSLLYGNAKVRLVWFWRTTEGKDWKQRLTFCNSNTSVLWHTQAAWRNEADRDDKERHLLVLCNTDWKTVQWLFSF